MCIHNCEPEELFITENNELHVVVGTGPLGIAVMEQLLLKNKKVRMVNRSGKINTATSVEVVRGDATNESEFRRACSGASVIYNCAKAPYTEWPDKFPPIMDGIIQVAQGENAKIVYADNLYMYGRTHLKVSESLPNLATGRKGLTRAKMAETLMDAHKKGKVRAVIGRAPDFYGPGVLDSTLGERVFGAVLEGKPSEVLGNIDVPHAYIYIKDFAKGLVELGEDDEAYGQIWHIPSAETTTTRDIITRIYRLKNQEPKFRVAPKLFVNLMSLFNADMREIKEMLYLHEEPFIVDTKKYERRFNKNVTSHEDAILETMEWFENRTHTK
ncbi:NAD-dependent epimerase/dehydratase family protein [Paenibacillus xylanexedens]|uniref:NAD-dependent epimerase/dehydratase family protein n=1 Tax=Paenibacillus xylanexedens TaxID=528191 RepID=UPI0011A30E16|nr:NAD-dependent epimerase/dehydratase family protein [Paenibacillus xylanexedens]